MCITSPLTKKQRIELLVREVNAQRQRTDAMWHEIMALRQRIEALEARPYMPWQPLPNSPYPDPGPYVSNTDSTGTPPQSVRDARLDKIIEQYCAAWEELAQQ
jgi:hypothetical protein